MQDRAWPTNGGQVTGLLEYAQMGSGQDIEFVVLQSGTTVRIQMLAPRISGFRIAIPACPPSNENRGSNCLLLCAFSRSAELGRCGALYILGTLSGRFSID